MPTATPDPQQSERQLPVIVPTSTSPQVVLPDEFLAYVEILRCADPGAYYALNRELAAADDGPAAVETASRLRRAAMVSSLEACLQSSLGSSRSESAPRGSAGR